MSCLSLPITDTAIKRHAECAGVRELNDSRHPLRLRYWLDRQQASWYLIQSRQGKKHWHKLGNWPQLTAKAIMPRIPELLAELAVKPSVTVSVAGWQNMEELLSWYGDRVKADKQISKGRRSTVNSAIRCHLVPLLGEVAIKQLNHGAIDKRFWIPLQSHYQLATIKALFAILRRSTRLAATLKLIEGDPLDAVTFGHFTTARIQPKTGALRSSQLAELLRQLSAHEPREAVFVLLMLLCGTRIGETRRAQWAHIDHQCWYIPPEHTKNRTEHRLPMTSVLWRLLSWWRSQSSGEGVFAGGAVAPSAEGASAWIRTISRRSWTAHDLRKLARTCWADLGVDYMVGELLLNHTLTKLDQTYIHTHAEAQKRAALETYHQWLMDNGLSELLEHLEG